MLLVLTLPFLTVSCASFQSKPVTPKIVTRDVPVAPDNPDFYTDCVESRTGNSFEEELLRLSKLIQCERARNAGLRAWRDRLRETGQGVDE